MRAYTHTHTHTSRLLCFSLTLQWSSQMYAYRGAHTHPETLARRLTTQLASRKWAFFQRDERARPSVWHNSLLLTHTSQRAAFNHSLTLTNTPGLCQLCLWASRHDWNTHWLPRKWMRASGWPGGQRYPAQQVTCHRFSANNGRYAHLWPR